MALEKIIVLIYKQMSKNKIKNEIKLVPFYGGGKNLTK